MSTLFHHLLKSVLLLLIPILVVLLTSEILTTFVFLHHSMEAKAKVLRTARTDRLLISTSGKVSIAHGDLGGPSTYQVRKLVVEFVDQMGRKVRTSLHCKSRPIKEGDEINVRYNGLNPAEVRINSRNGLWGLSLGYLQLLCLLATLSPLVLPFRT